MQFGEQAAQQIPRSFRCRIEFDFFKLGNFSGVSHYDAVNGAVGRNGNAVDDPIDRIAQKFETGYERKIKITQRKLPAKRGRMIEPDGARPAAN